MDSIIEMKHIGKEFKVLNRREGLKGSIQDLFSKNYRIVKAVDDISISIMPGEIVGYLGKNGAGKSTTIKIMTGVLEPSQGEILVNGKIPYKNTTENAQNIGVVFGQRSQLWWALPVIESFKILKEIYQISDEEYKKNMECYKSLVGVDDILHKTVRQMSLGQRTLCDILAAFLHNPSVVFLDEPTIGLDVSMKSKIRKLIKDLNQEKKTTVILTTHDMGDVNALCKRIVIIDKGKMIYDNSIENLKRYFGNYRTLKFLLRENEDETIDRNLIHIAEEIKVDLQKKFPYLRSIIVKEEDGWIDVLVNEDEINIIQLFNYIQTKRDIKDASFQEISTEHVIKKIYEGVI